MIFASIFFFVLSFGLLECIDIKVAAPYEEGGDEPCLRLCTGTTGKGSTPWKYYSTDGIYVKVDMTNCDFKPGLTPIVTSVLAGESHLWVTTGGSEIYSLTSSSFVNYVHMRAEYGNIHSFYKADKWRIDWQAIGYAC
ncbi:uncharacterized protein LOC134813493 [Bolinopsis microptera]|uniref:uncharacterized protein LOC134813493 n=1 Tax=Bolinopsis microptera TaxID=2820187 RepID=UPI003079EE31